MNTRKLLVSVLMLVSVMLAACAPAATPAPTAVPATALPPTMAPTVAPAQLQTTLSSKIFQLPMTARYGTEWSIQDEYADVVTLVGPAELAFIIVKNVKIADPMTSFSKMAFPDDFVGWIKSHGLFPVVDTQPVVVGGFTGIEINTQVTSDCGAKRDWLFLSGTGWNCRKGEYYHFILLNDVYGQRVLIMNTGGDDFSAEHFKAQVAASQQVLDTVVFSQPGITAQPTSPQLVEYKIPTSASEPGGIVAGPDGALWFVETAVNKIGLISTAGVVTEYPVPTASAIDTDQGFLAVGPDGALWFNEDLVNQIGRITTTGEVTEYKLPDEFKPVEDPGSIRAMVAGPDGALWITSPGANAIVKLTTDGKIAAKYVLPKAGSIPVGMVVGPDGALWFVEKSANQIGRITLDGKLSEYALPDNNSSALRITLGSDKAMWFTMIGVNKIGRISTDGMITTFDAAGMGPVGITSGADGALWFTGYGSTEIGRMTTDGKLTKIQVPTTASVPYHITAGPDGNLWFTEQQGNKIGQIQLSAPTAAQPLTTLSPNTFNLPITLSHGPEWSVAEEYSDEFLLNYAGHDAGVSFINVKGAKIADGIAFPDDFVTWIQSSDSLFQVVDSKSVLVGGFKGTQINATAACGNKTNWIMLSGTGWKCPNGENIGFIYLGDVHGERVLIQIQGSPDGKDYMFIMEESQKVLDTVVFSKP